VALCPLQIVTVAGVMFTVGDVFTVTNLLAVAVQFAAFVTVTV
jgi:hypothetical protein